MNCIYCTFFYTKKCFEPCKNCVNKDKFKIWTGEEKKNEYNR